MQLTGRCSLRDGVASLKARLKNLYHLGDPLSATVFDGAVNHGLDGIAMRVQGISKRLDRCFPTLAFKIAWPVYGINPQAKIMFQWLLSIHLIIGYEKIAAIMPIRISIRRL